MYPRLAARNVNRSFALDRSAPAPAKASVKSQGDVGASRKTDVCGIASRDFAAEGATRRAGHAERAKHTFEQQAFVIHSARRASACSSSPRRDWSTRTRADVRALVHTREKLVDVLD